MVGGPVTPFKTFDWFKTGRKQLDRWKSYAVFSLRGNVWEMKARSLQQRGYATPPCALLIAGRSNTGQGMIKA